MGKHKIVSQRYHNRWVNTAAKGHSQPVWNTHGTPMLLSIVVPNPRKKVFVAQIFDFALGTTGQVVKDQFFYSKQGAQKYCEGFIELYQLNRPG